MSSTRTKLGLIVTFLTYDSTIPNIFCSKNSSYNFQLCLCNPKFEDDIKWQHKQDALSYTVKNFAS